MLVTNRALGPAPPREPLPPRGGLAARARSDHRVPRSPARGRVARLAGEGRPAPLRGRSDRVARPPGRCARLRHAAVRRHAGGEAARRSTARPATGRAGSAVPRRRSCRSFSLLAWATGLIALLDHPSRTLPTGPAGPKELSWKLNIPGPADGRPDRTCLRAVTARQGDVPALRRHEDRRSPQAGEAPPRLHSLPQAIPRSVAGQAQVT